MEIKQAILVTVLKRKDKGSTEYLLDKYSTVIYDIIQKVVGDEKIAADLFLMSFSKIVNTVDSYEESKCSFFTWISNITRDTIEAYVIATPIPFGNINMHSLSPAKSNFQQTDIWRLIIFIKQIAPEYRSVLELFFLRKYSILSISELLKLPVETINTKIENGCKEVNLLAAKDCSKKK